MVPKVRFKGFTDEWEQRELGEVSEKITQKNKDNLYSVTLTNSAEYGIIDQRSFFDKDISNAKNLSNYYVVHPDDFVYNPRISNEAPVGPIKRNNLDITGVMSPLYYVFRPHDINKTFLEYYFSTSKWHKFMKLNGNSGARSDRFSIKDSEFVKMPIPSPKNEEQVKIGKLLSTVATYLALQQRKLDQLNTLKKGLLQKMFADKKNPQPELRFKGFSGDWEQHKLGNISNRLDNLRVPVTASKREKGNTPYYGANGIQDYVSGFTHDGQFVLIAEDGANDVNNYPIRFVTGKIWVNNHAHVLQGKIGSVDNKFLTNAIKKVNISTFLVGGSRAKLNADVLMKIKISIPTMTEQIKIGTMLSKIDNLIALQQSKLDKLNSLKKSLLQNMFI
jgi:type I restriction enzyme S subunit